MQGQRVTEVVIVLLKAIRVHAFNQSVGEEGRELLYLILLLL